MKTIQLLTAALLLSSGATAQNYLDNETENTQSVYLFAVQDDKPKRRGGGDCPMEELIISNQEAVVGATQDYIDTHRTGFQQIDQPIMILAQRKNKFSFGVGGYINMRAGYDFDGIVSNIDFIPYDIPTPGNYATKQKLMMDVTTSRVFLKGILNTEALGQVIVYIDADGRGNDDGNFAPRVRSAYVSFLGVTMGRDVTTFCDLDAAARTVDFQGPNAYNFNFATVLRYECKLLNDHLDMGIAAEYPKLWGTYGTSYAPIPQRVPDVPVYLQYAWGYNDHSHFRASAVFRNPHMYNLTTNDNVSYFGWGVQASGRVKASDLMSVVFNGVFGDGISQYIQDLTGENLDFMPNPEDPADMKLTQMFGWQAAAEFNITRRLSMAGGYSMVKVDKEHSYVSDEEYKHGQYMFGNVFYKITPKLEVAAEYLYGSRENMNDMSNHSNRVNLMAQFNF